MTGTYPGVPIVLQKFSCTSPNTGNGCCDIRRQKDFGPASECLAVLQMDVTAVA
jgi:hypothetical protein